MLFDTHCHLNFEAFDRSLQSNIDAARREGVSRFVVPGTDVYTSQKAVAIATKNSNIFAAVGIHPHHIFELKSRKETLKIESELQKVEQLLQDKSVVAIGEVGVDRHEYRVTKYDSYSVDEEFITVQKVLLVRQIELAIQYEKSLILHNRKAVNDILEVLRENWDEKLRSRTVFHCCEADEQLLAFAIDKGVYIGIDGDITWSKNKQRFIRSVPLEMLVLETDAPYLTPQQVRSTQAFPNEPKNITYVRDMVATVHNVSASEIEEVTTGNAMKLFNLM